MTPASRQARAAIAMDTTDMTSDFSATPRQDDLPVTDIRTALTRTVTAPVAGHRRPAVATERDP
jgi:hypothetical protein